MPRAFSWRCSVFEIAVLFAVTCQVRFLVLHLDNSSWNCENFSCNNTNLRTLPVMSINLCFGRYGGRPASASQLRSLRMRTREVFAYGGRKLKLRIQSLSHLPSMEIGNKSLLNCSKFLLSIIIRTRVFSILRHRSTNRKS